MRIRKRQVPFPLSSLSPVPLSDPHLTNRSPVVQLNDAMTPKPSTPQPEEDASGTTAISMDHQPSDQQLPPIGKARHGWDCSSIASESGIPKEEVPSGMCQRQEEDGGGGEKVYDTRRGSILGSETAAEVLPPSSPSQQADGRWYDGEKVIPLKKRRGTFDMSESNNNEKMKTRMKTKMNKKCTTSTSTWTQNDNELEDEEEEAETKRDLNVGKKRARGSALMEGSRCSRVNGRGWRCCQQTLVGYSLCEHHLGKGRLRSMTSVRSRSAATTTTTSTAPKKNEPVSVSVLSVSESDPILVAADSSSSDPEKKQSKCDALGNDDGEEKEEKKPLIITKKRMKLGMVKARSISSLLGQTSNTGIAVAENNK